MNPSLYLPIAGHSVSIYLLFGLGILVGFLAGMFGIGGGFLMTPLLIMIGIPPTVAAATDSNQIVAASTSGTYAHWRLGNVDFKMGGLLLTGGILGGTVGVQVIKILRAVGEADFVITVTYVVLLGLVGAYMFFESLHSLRTGKARAAILREERESWFMRLNHKLPLRIEFVKSGVSTSLLMPLVLGMIVGTLAAVMGIGGGFIMIPAMVYVLRMPMHVAVGTNLFQELFICSNVTFMQSYFNHTVDFELAFILLMGSTLGAQAGARISNRLKADQLKILLAVIVLIVMLKMLMNLLLPPHLTLSLIRGH